MASLIRDSRQRVDGSITVTYRVQIGGGKRPRQTIRLGRVSEKVANEARIRIAALEIAAIHAAPIDPATAAWLAAIRDDFHVKLVKVGLVEPREAVAAPAGEKLMELIDRYISSRANLKPNTRRNYLTTRRLLLEHFGPDRLVAEIHRGHAKDYREWLVGRYATATVSREIKRARQFLEYAKDCQLISSNPFEKIPAGTQRNRSRKYFVGQDVIARVLEALPDNDWRLALVLARFGGLRIPSELAGLTWGDIDWSGNRFTVRVPKKEHLEGHETRVVPIFPEIAPYLRKAFDDAEPGAVHVLPKRFHADSYVRAGVKRAVDRSGTTAWPKLMVNLRASRETELLLEWPEHIVHGWLGHTKEVADAHYAMTTDADFARAASPLQNAAQNAAHSGDVWSRQEPSRRKERAVVPANARYTADQAPPRGVEPRFSD